MSSVLILGGTGWLGRELATSALSAGHSVTCLARGESGRPTDGADLVQSDRALPDAYAAVAGRDWDRIIELSWNVDFVSGALSALAARSAHWTLISTVSVYASNSRPGADESDELLEPVDPGDYGQAKVAAERASAAALGDRLFVIRPGLIAGPGDPSDRFGYWVARMALAGNEGVLSMRTKGRMAQVIDVRDLAQFAVGVAGRGTVNTVGDSRPLAEVFELAARAAEFSGERVEAADEWLAAQDVGYWAGPRSLPLWLPPEDAAMMTRANAAYRAAGGTLRDLDATLRDILADERERGLERDRRSGLARADEIELLARLRG